MEQLLHYCWKHKLLPLKELKTADGRPVEIVHPGLGNPHAGPDFFNAKIRIDGTLWVGNVEIHDRSSDWQAHGHHQNEAYDSVILHVCTTIDRDVYRTNGQVIPQLCIRVPQQVTDNYQRLRQAEHEPSCHAVIPKVNQLVIRSWMAALQTERLEQKTAAISQRLNSCNGSWEEAHFITLSRNYGFGVNGDAFEEWARCMPLSCAAHHRDNLLQIEALFMGQAGLLDLHSLPERHRAAAEQDEYYQRLCSEYRFLAHKFSLTPMDGSRWRFLRMRPQNFPHVRIARLALLFHEGKAGLSHLVDCTSVGQVAGIYDSEATSYWQTHYLFGCESGQTVKRLSPASLRLLLINTAIPMLFAYGRHTSREQLCRRAGEWLEELKAENNHVTRQWKACGMEVTNAGESQALLQLKQNYCDKGECLRCRIGYEYLKSNINGSVCMGEPFIKT